jgi:excisionase family DNA binding protein
MNEHSVSVRVEEAAERLGVCRATLFTLIAEGRLRTFKVGRRRLIAVTELERFAERQTAIQNVRPAPPQKRTAS